MRNRSLIQLINATNPMSIAPTTMATRKPSRMYSPSISKKLCFSPLISKFFFDTYLTASNSQCLEYTHAFDIHTNSFVTFYFFSIIIPYFLLPICGRDNKFYQIFISNVLFFYGILYYFYVSYVEYFSLLMESIVSLFGWLPMGIYL